MATQYKRVLFVEGTNSKEQARQLSLITGTNTGNGILVFYDNGNSNIIFKDGKECSLVTEVLTSSIDIGGGVTIALQLNNGVLSLTGSIREANNTPNISIIIDSNKSLSKSNSTPKESGWSLNSASTYELGYNKELDIGRLLQFRVIVKDSVTQNTIDGVFQITSGFGGTGSHYMVTGPDVISLDYNNSVTYDKLPGNNNLVHASDGNYYFGIRNINKTGSEQIINGPILGTFVPSNKNEYKTIQNVNLLGQYQVVCLDDTWDHKNKKLDRIEWVNNLIPSEINSGTTTSEFTKGTITAYYTDGSTRNVTSSIEITSSAGSVEFTKTKMKITAPSISSNEEVTLTATYTENGESAIDQKTYTAKYSNPVQSYNVILNLQHGTWLESQYPRVQEVSNGNRAFWGTITADEGYRIPSNVTNGKFLQNGTTLVSEVVNGSGFTVTCICEPIPVTTTYYWYAGQTPPTSISGTPIVDDTNFTNNKWHTIGTTLTNIGKLVTGGTRGDEWYVAVPKDKYQPTASDLSTPDNAWTIIDTINVGAVQYSVYDPGNDSNRCSIYLKVK